MRWLSKIQKLPPFLPGDTQASSPDDILGKCLETPGEGSLFPEFAFSLYAFIALLHKRLLANGVQDVLFLSREGQLLMQLFSAYQHSPVFKNSERIRCHYLEVSRRSTFLPSLGPLESESFSTLFRQYKAISIAEFLASLGLDDHLHAIAQSLGITEELLARRPTSLPEDATYKRLLNSLYFRNLYESERKMRREAFLTYLRRLVGENLPHTLHLVDVGWKGTIQDNLYNLLCTAGSTEIRAIDGYYAGLVAPGAMSDLNRKHGILFSVIDGKTPGFGVFSENRALFETILAADHGSIASYRFDEQGKAEPVRSHYEEWGMVKEFILPLQRQIFKQFDMLLQSLPCIEHDLNWLVKTAKAHHARMVFKPTADEVRWFSTIYHVENFGVFENSHFKERENKNYVDRLIFTYRLIFSRRRVELGFWPWLSIRRRSFPPVAALYRLVRSGTSK
jgi:hypothetical protein